MIKFMKALLRPRPSRVLQFVRWEQAEEMLRAGTGWKVAKEEDRNVVRGWVYLERPDTRRDLGPPR